MAEAGSAKTLALSLLANIADPLNLIPASAFYKTARGVGLVKALKNAGAIGITAGITNTIQEELLRAMSPGEERDRLTADLQAFGYGFAFGSGLGFLSAPNFKPSTRGWHKWASHENLEATRTKIHAAWETEAPPRVKLGSLVDELEANRADLQQIIDAGLPNDATPQQPHQIVVLHRAEDASQSTSADRNAILWRQVQAKYGDRVQALEHPLQGDYDALSPLHRSLVDTEQAIRNLVKTDAKAAGAADLADNVADYIAQRGTTAFGKAMSFFTPTGVVDRSVLDLAHAAYRSLFHQGTVSKAAAMDPGYRGVVPAEVLKDSYQVLLYDAMAQARDAYAPDRLHGALLDRTDADRITLSTGKKIAALAGREPIRGTYADGTPFEIKPYNDYGTFIRTAMRLAREQKALDDGWAMLRDNRQQVPQQLQTASNAIRSFYDQMLDLADQTGLLPGKRTLEARHAEYDDAFDELQSAYAEMDAVEAQYPLAFNEPAAIIAQRVVDAADDWHAPITDQEMWDRMIGPARTIETPIGPVKIGANQFAKMQAKDRADFSGLVLPTLTKPSLVLREADGAVKFVRAFRRGKETIFLSISRDIEDAGQVVISNYPIRRAQLEKAIESGKPLYSTALDASAEASPQQAAQAGGRLDGESIIDQQGRQVQTLYTSVPKELTPHPQAPDAGPPGIKFPISHRESEGRTPYPRKFRTEPERQGAAVSPVHASSFSPTG